MSSCVRRIVIMTQVFQAMRPFLTMLGSVANMQIARFPSLTELPIF